MTGIDVKFSEAINSIPVLYLFERATEREEREREGNDEKIDWPFFFLSSSPASARKEGAPPPVKKSNSERRAIGAALGRVSSPTPALCDKDNAFSGYSARAEGHEGRSKEEKEDAGCFAEQQQGKQTTRVFFLCFLFRAAPAAERGEHHLSLSRSAYRSTHHCLFFSSSRIPKTSGSASTRGVSASGKTPSIFLVGLF
jgi:hypothetical protein